MWGSTCARRIRFSRLEKDMDRRRRQGISIWVAKVLRIPHFRNRTPALSETGHEPAPSTILRVGMLRVEWNLDEGQGEVEPQRSDCNHPTRSNENK